MIFLNESFKPLRECSDAEIAAIVRGGSIQMLRHDGIWGAVLEGSFLNVDRVYRTALRPMTINWDHVGEGWNHLRVDSDGSSWFFRSKPKVVAGRWGSPDGHAKNDDNNLFASFQRGDLPWDQAICDRPGHEVTP